MKLQDYEFNSLDHMTHIDNLKSIFRYGLLAHDNPYKRIDISNTEVNARRQRRENIYGRKIHDYVPFYFNPRNAMMYRNKEKDIIILAFSKKLLLQNNVIFTDKNASINDVHFYNNIENLDAINWDINKSTSWYGRPNEVKQIMMAETLVYNKVSVEFLNGIYCKNSNTKMMLMREFGLESKRVAIRPDLFFKY